MKLPLIFVIQDKLKLSTACQVAVIVLVDPIRHTLFREKTFFQALVNLKEGKERLLMATTVFWTIAPRTTIGRADPTDSVRDEGSTTTGDG